MTDKTRLPSQDVFYSQTGVVPLPLLVRAQGVRMWDDEGNDYIDVSSGPVVSNIGHGNTRVATAMAQQAELLDFAYSRVSRHQPNIDLATRISALAGPGYERVCLASGGSEAMEIAIKFLRQYVIATGRPEKKTIITLMPSYHGGTIAMLGLTGDDDLDVFVDGFAIRAEHIPAPFQYRVPDNHTPETWRMVCAEALDQKITELGAENVLAFVAEPIGGLATGALPMEEDYANRIREVCTHHGIYLVYDEILCGAGRTGNFLASHRHPDARADIVVLAKGLAAGYAPLGATLFPAEMVDRLADLTGFNFSHTYNANPITCATALAVLDEYDRYDLFAAARERGAFLRQRLESLAQEHSCIGDIRGEGLLMAVELVADREAKRAYPGDFLPTEQIRSCGLAHGLIIYSRRTSNGRNGDWFMVAPPLTITEAECDELVGKLASTLTDFEAAGRAHISHADTL